MTEDDFWNQPLAKWLRDCACGDPPIIEESLWRNESRRSRQLHYGEVCDGTLLTVLFNFIEPTSNISLALRSSEVNTDSATRQKLLRRLLTAIHHFYRERLQQLIVITKPDLPLIARSSSSHESADEVNKLLLLLLGCAIQSDQKRHFVERITKFDENVVRELALLIQQITESSSIVLRITDCSNTLVVEHLERVMKERDSLADSFVAEQESDEGSSTTTTSSLNGESSKRRDPLYDRRSPSPAYERHTSVELAHARSELRKTRKIAEEKDDEINDIRDELESKIQEVRRLQEEKLNLVKDARAAKDLRDELDCAQHKLQKLHKLEVENQKMREQADEMKYYKTRSEQLKEENALLEETIADLEEKLSLLQDDNRSKSDAETRYEKARINTNELREEISMKNEEIEQLLEEQYRLKAELTMRESRIAELEATHSARSPRLSFGSLADQLEDAEKQEMSRLKAENRKLRAQTEGGASSTEVEELKQAFTIQTEKTEELMKDNEKLKADLKQFAANFDKINENLDNATSEVMSIRSERDEAVKCLQEARRKFTQFQTEFGKRLEEESEFRIRELEFELKESKRNLQVSEEDRIDLETQLEKFREEQRKLRHTVDDLVEEKNQLESSTAHVDRLKKLLESERALMKEKTEKLEDELEEMRMKLMGTTDSTKRLEEREKLLAEQMNRLGDLESENRTLSQQYEIEAKKTQRMREDLISEKSKLGELVGRLRSLCAAASFNGGKLDTEMTDDQLIDNIDNVIMTALTTAKRESDALRIQQHTQIAELADLKRDIEKLRRSESASLTESDDRVRELTQENISIKEQVFIIQEKVRELNVDIAAKNSEILAARREIEELNRNQTTAAASNTELASLQVSLRNLQLQDDLFKQDAEELREKLEQSERSRQAAKKDADSLAQLHQTLLADHDRLQNLHDLLTHDYETAKRDNIEMKSKLRQQVRSPLTNNRELEEMRSQLAQERMAKDKQMRIYAELHNEHNMAKRQIEGLRSENEQLGRNRDALTSELRRLRVADQGVEWSTLVDDLNRQVQGKDLEIAKLNNKIDMLTQLNRTYDEENKNLSRQIEMLLTQNKDLLNRALSDKDQYHQEQKDFQERLSALRRHKEKLEEKIMDQYRSMESKKSGKQPLVKRAAKALINRKRATSNGGSTTEDSSTYSADERASPTYNDGKEDHDNLVPTCSSSEDQDRISPKYDNFYDLKDFPQRFNSLRQRGDPVGGSVRLPMTGNRSNRPIIHSRTYDQIFARESITPVISLPPRAPVRNSSVTASLRARPPPPAYGQKPKVSNPIYQNMQQLEPMSPPLFQPRSSSTPINGSPARENPNEASTHQNDRPVVREGERRDFIREKDERLDKAMSFYENVNNVSNQGDVGDKANESTVWYEYGCV